jgi:hypothetical protein
MGDTAEQKARVTDKPEVVPVRLWEVGGSNWSLPLIAGGSRRIRRRFLPAALAERGVRCEGRGIRGEGRGIRDEVRGMRDEGRGVRCERIFPRGAKGLTPGGLGYICTRGRAEWPTRGQKADPSTDLPGSTSRRPRSPAFIREWRGWVRDDNVRRMADALARMCAPSTANGRELQGLPDKNRRDAQTAKAPLIVGCLCRS